jgi:hypothetical protein
MVTVDLTPCELAGVQAGFGSEVTLWGKSNTGAILPIDDVALCPLPLAQRDAESMMKAAQGCPTIL